MAISDDSHNWIDHTVLAFAVALVVACVAIIMRQAPAARWATPLFLLLTLMLMFAAHTLTNQGFFRQPERYQRVIYESRATFLPRLTSAQAVDYVRRQHAKIVDTRDYARFEEWHIAGAIHIPAGVPAPLRVNMMSGIDRTTPLIVYCAGGTCSVDQLLAGELLDDGFTRVLLLHRVKASPVEIDRLLRTSTTEAP